MTIISTGLIALGTILLLVSSFGVYRLPDVYCRSHALAKSMPLAINLMLIGAWIYLGHDKVGIKTFLAIVFQIVSIPVAGHLLGLLALEKKLPRWKEREIDYHDNRSVES